MLLQLLLSLFLFHGVFSANFSIPTKEDCKFENERIQNCKFPVYLNRLDNETMEAKQTRFENWTSCMGVPKCELNQKILERYTLKFDLFKRIASEYGPCETALMYLASQGIPGCHFDSDQSCEILTPILCTVDIMARVDECDKKDIKTILDRVPLYVRYCNVKRDIKKLLEAEKENQ